MVIIIDMHKIDNNIKLDNYVHTAAAKQQRNESFRLVYSLDMTHALTKAVQMLCGLVHLNHNNYVERKLDSGQAKL